MAVQDYLAGINLKYVGVAIAVVVGIFILFRLIKGGGWIREQEEKTEIAEEKELTTDTKKELKLQKQEKKILKELVSDFTGLLNQYALLISSIESTGFRSSGQGQATLSPQEILKVLQTIIALLNNMKKENLPIKSEESTFDKVVNYWRIAFKEMGAWAYVPDKQNKQKMDTFQKAYGKIQEIGKRINDKIIEMGMELSQEYALDEKKKKEILDLYQRVVKETGTRQVAA